MSVNYKSNFDFNNPNYSLIFKKRIELLKKLNKDKELRQAFFIHYSTNPVDFIEDWLMTTNPKNVGTNKPVHMPFILFPKQKEYINWLYDKLMSKEDGLAEKSRDVGFTWLGVAFSDWAFRFVDDIQIGWGSRKGDLVDKSGNPDSIFEKLRYSLNSAPSMFLPRFVPPGSRKSRLFSTKEDALFMRIVNHRNGAVIKGEAGDNIGRGGRNTMYFTDEAAFIDNFQSTMAALSQNADVKIYLSTYNGMNDFYRLRNSGDIDVFTFSWEDDPRKSRDWYEKEKAKTDPVIFAQEVDMNPQGSTSNTFIPYEWIIAAVDFISNPSGIKRLGYDVARGNDDQEIRGDKFAMCERTGVAITHIEDWKYKDSDTSKDTQKVYYYGKFNNIEIINYDNTGVGAGAHGEFTRLKEEEKDSFSQFVQITGLDNSGAVTDVFDVALGRNRKDRLLNAKSEMWWELRIRFWKTYRQINGIQSYNIDELISIPNDKDLIDELSAPKLIQREDGKIQVEPKKQMSKRGIKSPNKADAVALAFAPIDSQYSLDNL